MVNMHLYIGDLLVWIESKVLKPYMILKIEDDEIFINFDNHTLSLKTILVIENINKGIIKHYPVKKFKE